VRKSAILVGIVAMIVGSQSDVPAQSYPLVCRGPLTVEFGQNHQPTLIMRFGQGRKPATQGVEPGTCAWMDRGVRSNEPDCLMHSPRDVRVRVVQPSSADRASAPAAESFRSDVAGKARREPGTGQAPDSGALRATPPRFEISSMSEAPYLESIVTTSAKTHIFQAYRKEGWACLQVERLGP
jgi:hypothetical protein